MLTFTNALLAMVSLFNAGLATFLLRGNWRRPTNIFLGTYLAALCIWPIALICTQITHNYDLWFYSTKITYAAGLIIAASFYLFSIAFPEERMPSHAQLVVVGGLVAVFIAFMFLIPTYLVLGIVPQGSGNAAVLDPVAYLTFVGLFCFLYVGGLVRVWRKYLRAEGLVRRRLLIIGLGVAITGIGGLYYDIILASPFINEFQYIWTGPLFNTLTAVLLVYAVFRLGFLNVKVILTEFLIVLLWILTLLRTLLASDPQEQLFNGALFLFSVIIGLLLIRSVGREVRQREMIEAQERDLEVANQKQESLLHFISHEIKGYLTKNEAAFDAIRVGDYGETTPQLKEMANAALIDTRKGVATVIDILDAANLKKGTVEYAKKEFDLVACVGQIVQDLTPSAAEKGLHLIFHRPVSGAYAFVGDEDKIRRHVIRNIIDNSIKYTQSGEVVVDMAKTDTVYRIVVKDTGVGITPEDMARLFTEGGHGKESIKVNVHSTGYGLFIAKTIVDAHHGKVWAESEGAGKGSRFIVELPIAA